MNEINQKLTKKEKYFLKKQKKENEHLRKMRNRKIKKMLFISLSVLFVVGSIVLIIINYSPEESHPGISKIEINPQEYDAGTISIADGVVKYTYEIKNIGEGDLKIDRIWTSCMCTTARLIVGDERSGEFGMHSNPIFWSQKIAPGKTAYLEVVFDPAFHKEQETGPIVRAVYLLTNDPQNEEVEAKLIANIIK